MKFILTTEKGSKIEMFDGTRIGIEIDGEEFDISIIKK